MKKDRSSPKRRNVVIMIVVLAAGIVIASAAIYRESLVNRAVSPAGPIMRPIDKVVPVRKEAKFDGPIDSAGKPISVTRIEALREEGIADVISASPQIFAYAHGTVEARGRMFVGMEDRDGNLLSTDKIFVFLDEKDLKRYTVAKLPHRGSVDTIVYDKVNDKLYFVLGQDGLEIYSLDPQTLLIKPIMKTSLFDAGRKPAIVTDGSYIYGITNTDDSTVFKVGIRDGSFAYDSRGHIHTGHSVALSVNGSTTELYFGGGMGDGFEKVDAGDLSVTASLNLGKCDMNDDMPFARGTDGIGYVYVGCEIEPYGYRIRVDDMSVARFSLPGSSLGMFEHDGDIFNTARDGNLDVFRSGDMGTIRRLHVRDSIAPLDPKGVGVELNELMFSGDGRMFITAWWGIPGLYEISTTSKTVSSTTVSTLASSTHVLL